MPASFLNPKTSPNYFLRFLIDNHVFLFLALAFKNSQPFNVLLALSTLAISRLAGVISGVCGVEQSAYYRWDLGNS